MSMPHSSIVIFIGEAELCLTSAEQLYEYLGKVAVNLLKTFDKLTAHVLCQRTDEPCQPSLDFSTSSICAFIN